LQQVKDLSKQSYELQTKNNQLQYEKSEFAKTKESDIDKMKSEMSELTDNHQKLQKNYEALEKANTEQMKSVRGDYWSYLREMVNFTLCMSYSIEKISSVKTVQSSYFPTTGYVQYFTIVLAYICSR